MARLDSLKQKGGEIGDVFVDHRGKWEIMTVFADGRYAWSLKGDGGVAEEGQPFDMLTYVRQIDRRLAIVENAITQLASITEEMTLISKLLGDRHREMNGNVESVFDAITTIRQIAETSVSYISASVQPLSERMDMIEQRINQ